MLKEKNINYSKSVKAKIYLPNKRVSIMYESKSLNPKAVKKSQPRIKIPENSSPMVVKGVDYSYQEQLSNDFIKYLINDSWNATFDEVSEEDKMIAMQKEHDEEIIKNDIRSSMSERECELIGKRIKEIAKMIKDNEIFVRRFENKKDNSFLFK